MILVTRINGAVFALNPDLVERADCTPDTVVTLVDGTKYVISESVPEFIDSVRHYRASLIAQANTTKFRAEVTGAGMWMDDSAASTGLKNYEAMKTILRMPIVGTQAISASKTSYVCSYFPFDWAGKVRKTSTRVQFVSEFVPNMSQWVAQGAIGNLADGAFGVTGLLWHLTLPATCTF